MSGYRCDRCGQPVPSPRPPRQGPGDAEQPDVRADQTPTADRLSPSPWAARLRGHQEALAATCAALQVAMDADASDALYHIHRYTAAALVEIGRAVREAEGAGGHQEPR